MYPERFEPHPKAEVHASQEYRLTSHPIEASSIHDVLLCVSMTIIFTHTLSCLRFISHQMIDDR